MSVSVVVAGISYTIPQVGEVTWGANVTSWIQAISSSTLQTSGGSFVLTGDLNFGTNFGLIAKYYTSLTANAASAGAIRLANADGIGWRNVGNSADYLLKPDADGILQYNSIDLVNLSATQTLTNKTIAAASNTVSGLTNANLSGAAAITNANLATMAANTLKANVTAGVAVPTDVAIVSAATASAAMIRDASANVQANNLIENFATTVTAAGTTTLTVASAFNQQLTGSTTQTVVLPAASALVLGQQFAIANRSSGVVTVNANGGGLIQAMATNTQVLLTVTNIGSGPGVWDVSYSLGTPTMTTLGDLIIGGASGVPTRLGVGSSLQVLGISAGSPAWKTLTVPSVQKFTSTGTTTGQLFTVTSANATVGATYTNNAQTFTVLATISGATQLFTSQTGAPAASGTLTKATGSGDATITFSAALALATYTTPAGAAYLKVKMMGGGAGGGGSGTGAPGTGGVGTASYFGPALLSANGGSGGAGAGAQGGGGGTASIGAAIGLAISGGTGSGATGGSASGVNGAGGTGAVSPLGGAGNGGSGNSVGGNAIANTGSGGGGGGGGGTASSNSGSGGGAGGFVDAILTAPNVTYVYAIGTGGAAGGAGTSGLAGGTGAAGQIIVEEHYQ